MSSDTKLVTVDVNDLLNQVLRRLQDPAPAGENRSAVTFHAGPVPRWKPILAAKSPPAGFTATAEHLQAIRKSFLSTLEPSIERLGEMPPCGATFRARLGRVAIRGLQQLLWWYTAPIRVFAAASWKHLQEELAMLESLADAQEAARNDIAALREEVRQVRAHLEALSGSPPR